MRSLSYHKYIMVIGYWCWGRWKRWPQLKQSNMKEKIRHWAQKGKWVGLESGSNFGSGQSVSKSGTFEKRGMEVCSTQDLLWDSTNATVLWSPWSSSLFPHLSKSQGFVQKVKVGIYAMHCNVWPALICGSWAECVKDWSLENCKMMRWSWFWKMRSYSSSDDGEW